MIFSKTSPRPKSRTFFTLVFLFCFFWIFLIGNTVYQLFFYSKDNNPSLTQSWINYDSVIDWDLAGHATLDIGGDGENDMITFPHKQQPACAILSHLPQESIPQERRCDWQNMPIISGVQKNLVGQTLQPQRQFLFPWLQKSFVAQTQSGEWRYIIYNGFEVRVFSLNESSLFLEKSPSLLDRIDAVAYTFSNLGITLLLILLFLGSAQK